ncbi:sunset domain-containing protein [Kribbella monticola]|uniref:sunset domain-containing protein n=1 Tax=Kribbella monticola TaxID=2185285 RepID=UPI0018E50573|nr:hypothetical protein [Kribbella monticola]
MSWLFRNNWPWSLLAFLLGAIITWFLLARRPQPQVAPVAARQATEEKADVLVGAAARATGTPDASPPPSPATPKPTPAKPAAPAEPAIPAEHAVPVEPAEPAVPVAQFSQRMDAGEAAVPTLFDEPMDDVPPGRYGEGSADAVPHQGPPDGFTIKGNAQSMLFHTPESPYYGRTRPEVWFRTEADAERAGFTKYVRKPRKSPTAGK